MMRIPGLYPISVAALAGLGCWVAYDSGRGPSMAEQVLASRPKQALPREASNAPPAREAQPAFNLSAEIGRMTRRDLSQLPTWVQLAEWEKIRSFTLPQIKEAVEIVLATDGTVPTSTLQEMLFARWAELDPEDALAAAAEQQEKSDFTSPGNAALWTWLQRDSEAARHWADANPDLAEKFRMIPMLSALLEKETPVAALEKSELLGKEVLHSTLLGLTRKMALDEAMHPEFFKLLEKFPEDQRDKMLLRFTETWCASDPARALDGLEGLIPDEVKRNELRDRSLKRWGRSQPADTLAWMAAHPEETRSEDQAYVWREWVDKRPEDAMDWLESRGEDAALAEALVRHLQTHGSNDPFSRPVSTQRQSEGLRRSYQVWARADAEEAARWLASADPRFAASIKNPAPEAK